MSGYVAETVMRAERAPVSLSFLIPPKNAERIVNHSRVAAGVHIFDQRELRGSKLDYGAAFFEPRFTVQ